MSLSHFDDQGASRMVDVSAKGETARVAVAAAEVTMAPETLRVILDRKAAKGDVLEVARLAGIMAAKRVDQLIPLCHALPLTGVEIAFRPDTDRARVAVFARVRCHGRTGVEMEALTAVAVAALTIYDMCKAVDKAMVIGQVRLLEKRGGKSGVYQRPGEDDWPFRESED